jgi:hypothetical protein
MSDRPIQAQLGQAVMDAVRRFALADIKTPDMLITDEFRHVAEPRLRRRLADIFYGAKWIYKLGLVLLARDEERAAHVRAQVIDYGSVVEGLLLDAIAHAIRGNLTRGNSWQWRNPKKSTGRIPWNAANPEAQFVREKLSLWWLTRVAAECGIIDTRLEQDIEWLREARNKVHPGASAGHQAYLNQSKKASEIVMRVIVQTRTWKALHP